MATIPITLEFKMTGKGSGQVKLLNADFTKLAPLMDRVQKAMNTMAVSAEQAAASLNKLERSEKRVARGAKKMNKDISLAGKAMKNIIGVSKAMVIRFAVLGGVLAGVFAVKAIIDFEAAMARLLAVTDASINDFQRMEEAALKLGKTTQFSATEAAEAMEFLGRTGFQTNQILQALPATLDLAVIGNLEIARAADIASNVLKTFRLETSRTNEVVDILAATSVRSNTDINQLAEAIKFAGPVAAQLGIPLSQLTGVIGVLGDAGLQASLAGTGLRRVLSSLVDPTTAAEKTLRRLGLRLSDVDPKANSLTDIFKKLAASGFTARDAFQLFQDRGGTAAIVINAAADSAEVLTKQINGATGEAKKLSAIIQDTLLTDIKNTGAAFQALAVELGKSGLKQFFSDVVAASTAAFNAMERVAKESREATDELKRTNREMSLFAKIVAEFSPAESQAIHRRQIKERQREENAFIFAFGFTRHDLDRVARRIAFFKNKAFQLAEGDEEAVAFLFGKRAEQEQRVAQRQINEFWEAVKDFQIKIAIETSAARLEEEQKLGKKLLELGRRTIEEQRAIERQAIEEDAAAKIAKLERDAELLEKDELAINKAKIREEIRKRDLALQLLQLNAEIDILKVEEERQRTITEISEVRGEAAINLLQEEAKAIETQNRLLNKQPGAINKVIERLKAEQKAQLAVLDQVILEAKKKEENANLLFFSSGKLKDQLSAIEAQEEKILAIKERTNVEAEQLLEIENARRNVLQEIFDREESILRIQEQGQLTRGIIGGLPSVGFGDPLIGALSGQADQELADQLERAQLQREIQHQMEIEADEAKNQALVEANAQMLDAIKTQELLAAQSRVEINAAVGTSAVNLAQQIAGIIGTETKAGFALAKAAAIAQAIINTAVAITQVAASPPLVAVVAGIGAAQIGIIAGTAIAGFEHGGVVKGSGPSESQIDSVLLRATPGERILTPKQTNAFDELITNENDENTGGTIINLTVLTAEQAGQLLQAGSETRLGRTSIQIANNA